MRPRNLRMVENGGPGATDQVAGPRTCELDFHPRGGGLQSDPYAQSDAASNGIGVSSRDATSDFGSRQRNSW
jgi:hypothetical protein